jgi:hypothetical protein
MVLDSNGSESESEYENGGVPEGVWTYAGESEDETEGEGEG